ncbi:MAG: flagellar export protein FliJ [Candidatus Coatesbacteria bacterium]
MIKKFQFRLEQVLRHRANLLELKERALAEVQAQLVRERQVLGGLLELKAEVLAELANLQAGEFVREERDLYQHYLDWLGEEQAREVRAISDLEALADAKRAELVGAQQDHKIVERLKERQHGTYLQDLARAEQGELDEVAGTAFARLLREAGDVRKGNG